MLLVEISQFLLVSAAINLTQLLKKKKDNLSGYLVWQSFIDVFPKFCPFPPNKGSCYKTCNCASSFVKWRERYLPQGSVRQLELESDSARSFNFCAFSLFIERYVKRVLFQDTSPALECF